VKVQAKGSTFKKIIAENFTILKKEMTIYVHEAYRTPNRHDQNRISTWNIIAKTISTKNKERILKAIRE
jgi:hypothetical protein